MLLPAELDTVLGTKTAAEAALEDKAPLRRGEAGLEVGLTLLLLLFPGEKALAVALIVEEVGLLVAVAVAVGLEGGLR